MNAIIGSGGGKTVECSPMETEVPGSFPGVARSSSVFTHNLFCAFLSFLATLSLNAGAFLSLSILCNFLNMTQILPSFLSPPTAGILSKVNNWIFSISVCILSQTWRS